MIRFVKAPGPRSTISTTASGLEIAIPSRKNWFIILFLALWLAIWTVGGIEAAREFFDSDNPGPDRQFMSIWLFFWALGEAFALTILAWSFAGREVVRFESSHVELRREVAGVGISKHYDRLLIANLRVAPNSSTVFDPRQAFAFWGVGGGLVAFDYGAATVRFANSVDEAEASAIVREIKSRYAKFEPVSA